MIQATTEEQKVEKLLQPRCRMKINMPCSSHKKGEIIYGNGASINTHRSTVDVSCSAYPDCYESLPWWAEREAADLPEYVKGVDGYFKGKVYKIAHPSQNGREWHIDGEIEHQAFVRYASDFLPATSTEYNNYIYINKLNQKQ